MTHRFSYKKTMMKPSTALTLGAFALAATSCEEGNQKAYQILENPLLTDEEISPVCDARTDFETQTCKDADYFGAKSLPTPCEQIRAYARADCLATLLKQDRKATGLSPQEVEALCRTRTSEVLRARVTQITPSQLINHCRSHLSGKKR